MNRSHQEEIASLRAEISRLESRNALEAQQAKQETVISLAQDMLECIDNLNRALVYGSCNRDVLMDGVSLTEKEMRRKLSQHGITMIEALGKRFNPKLHEAVEVDRSSLRESGIVTHVLRAGYLLGDRLVRPSQVTVSG